MSTQDRGWKAALADLAAAPAPQTQADLDRRVRAVAGCLGIPEQRARRLLAAVVVAQMLPDGVMVKGGIGAKIRLGETGTRATSDLDVATRDQQRAVADLKDRLKQGWGTVPASKKQLKADPSAPARTAFFGELREGRQGNRPRGVDDAYLMDRYLAPVHFISAKWTLATVTVEIGVDEFEGSSLSAPDYVMNDQVDAAVAALGCGAPRAVPVMSLEQQLAQKIHAVTDPEETRGHDLVDIQLLWQAGMTVSGGLDLDALAGLCARTFAFRAPGRAAGGRGAHDWPPRTGSLDDLGLAYETALVEARAGLDDVPDGVARDLTTAQQWRADIIRDLDVRVASRR